MKNIRDELYNILSKEIYDKRLYKFYDDLGNSNILREEEFVNESLIDIKINMNVELRKLLI